MAVVALQLTTLFLFKYDLSYAMIKSDLGTMCVTISFFIFEETFEENTFEEKFQHLNI